MSQLPPVNPYAAPQASVDSAGAGEFQYKPLGGRALAVTITLGVFCVFALLTIVTGVGLGSSAQTMTEAWQDETPVTTGDLLEFGQAVGVVATIIALCFFFPQANRNSRALTGERLRFSPASTMWWFFVPFMNLVRPYQAVREIWQSSTATAQELWSSKPAPWWLRLWWGTWITFNVMSRMTERIAQRAVQSGEGIAFAETLVNLERIITLVAAGCLIHTVRKIASAQAQRFSAAPPAWR